MKYWLYYTQMAIRDTVRLRGSLVATTMIVLSICLPLLLLLGLTAGLVRQQIEQLLRSPSSREMLLWVASGKTQPLTKAEEERLLHSYPQIALIIPNTKKVVSIKSNGGKSEVSNVTLLPTKPGDPLLSFHHASLSGETNRGIVLARTVADQLFVTYQKRSDRGFTVEPGQTVSAEVTRNEEEGKPGKVSVPLEVQGIVDLGDGKTAYADCQLLESIESYQQGQEVRDLGWPAFAKPAPVGYQGYLCFCKASLSGLDQVKLAARGLSCGALDHSNPSHAERRSLGGLLKSHKLDVYFLGNGGLASAGNLSLSSSEVEDITEADDIVVPWSEPLNGVQLNGKLYRLFGLSLQRRWLRSLLHDPDAGFSMTSNDPLVQLLSPLPSPGPTTVRVDLPSGHSISFKIIQREKSLGSVRSPGITALLNAVPAAWDDVRQQLWPWSLTKKTTPRPEGSSASRPKKPGSDSALEASMTALVPASVLAQLHALSRGEVTFDDSRSLFIPAPKETSHYQARVYPHTLYDVPTLDALLRAEGYSIQSERTRVEEIQEYAQTLNLLVWIVGGTVSLFGIWTLLTVLWDNTARKRGSLGILLGLGVSRLGLLYFVLARALLIGFLAGLVSIPLALLLTQVLTIFGAHCHLQGSHLLSVVGVASFCCLLGGIIPAFHASRLDPSVAITEGSLR